MNLNTYEGLAAKRAATPWYLVLILFFLPCIAWAQEDPGAGDLKGLSIEELMDLEVTSVSRKPEKLLQTPSAIQVVTGEDMLRFGATNIPEALYLAGNLQVGQRTAHSWAISARGFNTELANKLLVQMDGRTVYTPLFSGVFWDRHDYILNDLNQIEVISGPGGTLWGANAVNGVISITSKSARDTQGLFAEAAAGNELKTLAGVRYGGKLGESTFYRVYAKYGSRDNSIYPDSIDANDKWTMMQGGFRIDSEKTSNTRFTLQGDIYQSEGDLPTGGTAPVKGANILGRWSHTFADSSDLRLQMYFDRTDLTQPTPAFVTDTGIILAPAGDFKDVLNTFDIDFQYRLTLGSINHIVTGAGYRFTHDEVTNSPSLGFFPTTLKQNLFSVFVQDELTIVPSLILTAGTKLEHNAYTGYVLEPNARLRWRVSDTQMIWAAVSRAVRIPSRIDRNYTQATPPHFVLLKGSDNFQSETVVSTELGYRGQLGAKATSSISLYYNQYDNLRSTELDPVTVFPLFFANGLEGDTYGVELNLNYQVAEWWRLTSSYYLMRQDIRVKEGKSDFSNALNETADPGFQFLLRSSFQLPYRFSINGAFRWIDGFTINSGGTALEVPSYAELDGRISWQASEKVQLSIAGRNLLNAVHEEYGVPATRLGIQRSVYGSISVTF